MTARRIKAGHLYSVDTEVYPSLAAIRLSSRFSEREELNLFGARLRISSPYPTGVFSRCPIASPFCMPLPHLLHRKILFYIRLVGPPAFLPKDSKSYNLSLVNDL